MALSINTTEVSVILLFNLDPCWSTREQQEVIDTTSQLENALTPLTLQTVTVPVSSDNISSLLAEYDPLKYLVFNWCESIPGVTHSEWQVVEQLESLGFTFTGAGSSALALAQDKHRVKRLLCESGINTPVWQVYDEQSSINWDRFPAIIKPSREHCSEGIDRNAVVNTESELRNRIAYILGKYRQPALVEDFIDGRELHVSLWGNGKIEMLPPAEMEFSLLKDHHDRICSYEAKFVPESSPYQNIQTVLPAPLRDDQMVYLERLCKSAYLVTGCRDYARIDLRLTESSIYLIDVNPNPDISPDTSMVSAAELIGYTYGEMGGRILQLAAGRHPIWGQPDA